MEVDTKAAAKAVDQLTKVLGQLESEPNNVPLIRTHLGLLRQLQLSSEALDAVNQLATLIMLDEATWIQHLADLVSSFQLPLELEAFLDIVEKYTQAEQDYLSFRVLSSHIDFIIRCALQSSESAISVHPDLAAFLERETVRGMLKEIVDRGNGLLTQSQELWQAYLSWELAVAEMPRDLELLNGIYVERLSTPHTAMDDTSSQYSTFCSQHSPNTYETNMVAATSASQTAKFKLSGEKRFGKTRMDFEQSLATDPITPFSAYIDWETDPRARNPKNARAPSTDRHLTISVFERAIAAYANAAATMESSGSGDISASVRAYKDAEAGMWRRYASWVEEPEKQAAIAQRASRACPQVGAAWALHLQHLLSSQDEFTPAFDRALSLDLLVEPKDLADVYVSRAARDIRQEPELVLSTLSLGMEAISKVSKQGDPNLQLEIFLLEWAETAAIDMIDQALSLVERPNKSRASSHRLILQRSGIQERRKNIDEAREILAGAIKRTDLDWPEAVSEAWLRFENIHGSMETLVAAQKTIDVEMQKLSRRREKDAQAQMEQYQTTMAAAQPVDVTMGEEADRAEPIEQPAGDSHFKRDRENTTILVSGLPTTIDSAAIEEFFHHCGNVRETTIITGEPTSSALVEFRFADAVPGALSLDRKKFHGSEIGISMLWRSTLFVTNFPRDMDDDGMRKLFSQYGMILPPRWPSRKYADSRRFCYITMESPAAAQEALILHGMQMGEFGLTVLVSDPSAKTRRTDTSSANATIFVGGLTPKATDYEVEELLKSYGTVTGLKLGWDPVKSVCKGFAFVEMGSEDEAKAALALSGLQHKGKFLKVDMHDSNYAAKRHDKPNNPVAAKAAAERRARSVRLHGLPENTQEGLLQQALEKLVPVKRLELFASSHEALAELEAASDVGTLLLRTDPFLFEGATITFTQQDRRPPPHTAHANKKRDEPTTALKFAPRAARRGKALGKAPAIPRAAGSAVPPAPTQGGQVDFRALVQSTNAQRAKRGAEEEAEGDSAKRPKPE